MKNGGAGGATGLAGDMMQLGVGLGTMGSVIGMAKEAITPVTQAASGIGGAIPTDTWDCACGAKGIASRFCPDCGAKRPQPQSGWTCPGCGRAGITSRFCPECGMKKPEPDTWDCSCGRTGITSKFCPDCGKKKGE